MSAAIGPSSYNPYFRIPTGYEVVEEFMKKVNEREENSLEIEVKTMDGKTYVFNFRRDFNNPIKPNTLCGLDKDDNSILINVPTIVSARIL